MLKKKLLFSASILLVTMSSISVNAANLSENSLQTPTQAQDEQEFSEEGEDTDDVENENSLPDFDISTDNTTAYPDANSSLLQDTDNTSMSNQIAPRGNGTWIESGGRWWYKHYDGSYTRNNWEEIDGIWYHFDSSGWMEVEKWIVDNGKWYYVNAKGAMVVESWMQLGGKWYYFDGHGVMATEWRYLGQKWYYFGTDGKMTVGPFEQNGSQYVFNANGALTVTRLGVRWMNQEKSMWCWAATAAMIGRYDSIFTYSQEQIVKAVKGKVVNEGANTNESIKAIYYASGFHKNAQRNGVLGFNDIVSRIDNRHPFAMVLENAPGWGHMVVGSGYNTTIDYVCIVNPGGVAPSYYPYDGLIAGIDVGGQERKFIYSITY